MPLKIAAKIDRVDRDYFETTIKPLLSQPGIEYIGEITEDQKSELLGERIRTAVPGRLAGTVRAGDDRSDGLRNADDCV